MNLSRHQIPDIALQTNGVTVMPSSADERPLIFNVGNDAALLSYRGDVLRVAGFRVLCIHLSPWRNEEFHHLCHSRQPHISIACHTLNTQQRIALATECRTACPDAKLLALTSGEVTDDEASLYDVLLDSLDGPAALILHLRAQLDPAP